MLVILAAWLPFDSNWLAHMVDVKLEFKDELAVIETTQSDVLPLFHPNEFVDFCVSYLVHSLNLSALLIIVKSLPTVDTSHFNIFSLHTIEPVNELVERVQIIKCLFFQNLDELNRLDVSVELLGWNLTKFVDFPISFPFHLLIAMRHLELVSWNRVIHVLVSRC